MTCVICGDPSDTRLCGEQCRELNDRLTRRNLTLRGERQPAADEDADDSDMRIDPDPPQSAVLYGLLTFADVHELRRRRERFAAAGRTFPDLETHPQPAGCAGVSI